jgi:hypothetical protein
MVSRKPPTRQVHASRITLTEKQAIIGACERFITDVLKPRFLPEIRPTEWNYPVGILGRWRGNRYRFIQRYRSDGPDAIQPEFDASFARLDWILPGLCNVAWQ